MPGWAWGIIGVAAVVLVAVIVWRALAAKRTRALQGRFGPEYDRALDSSESRRQAEADLKARAERRDELDIRPLPRAHASAISASGSASRRASWTIRTALSARRTC